MNKVVIKFLQERTKITVLAWLTISSCCKFPVVYIYQLVDS